MTASNFLEVNAVDNSSCSDLFKVLEGNYLDEPSDFKSIVPTRGFCVKSKTDNNEKVFLNICHSSDIPPPAKEHRMCKAIEEEHSDDKETLLRIPMSLGDPHLEHDKSGNKCRCFDIVINSEYYHKEVMCGSANSKKFAIRDFCVTLACAGLEEKHNISIDIETCIFLNKPYHGEMPTHYIRLERPDMCTPQNDDVVMPVQNPLLFTEPEIVNYKMFNVSVDDIPSYIVFQGLTRDFSFDDNALRIFIGKSELSLQSHCKIIFQISLPCDVIPQSCVSNFYNNRLVVWMKKFCKGEK